MRSQLVAAAFACFSMLQVASAEDATTIALIETQRHFARDAFQAVAVDDTHFYAINNASIGKHQKESGKLVRRWESSGGVKLKHLNSGVVIDGKLYCSHSNYPTVPESSSVEIFDTATMKHVGNHSFGIYEGSLTWVDWHNDSWWCLFAHYSKPRGGDGPAKDNRWTTLVRFDKQWRRLAGWTFPPELLERFAPNSCSGGAWSKEGRLYVSGHDRAELYEVQLPKAGSTLIYTATVKTPFTGQGFAWDRDQDGVAFGINRLTRQVIMAKLQ